MMHSSTRPGVPQGPRHSAFSYLRAVIPTLLLLSLLAAALPANTQEQPKQRPRRVTDSSNQSPQPQGSPSTAGEDVDEGDVVRVETQLVTVPAVIKNSGGRPITGLRRDNFVVFEDGQQQSISNFGTSDAPFEIALLLDTSGSTREDVSLIREAAMAFINSLRPGDRVAIVAFNTDQDGSNQIATVEILSRLTSDRKLLQRAIGNVGSANGTPFYDALNQIALEIFRDPPSEEIIGRRAVVALTDGVDSASDTDFVAARGKLTRAGIACYFIQVNTEDFVEDRLLKDCQDDGRLSLSVKQLQRYRAIFIPRAKSEDYTDFCKMGQFERMQISRELYNLARREMNDLAKASGGKNFVATTLVDARAAFAQVATEIGTQYSLGYYPTNKARDGKYRTIRVEVRGVAEKPQVRAREGYVAPSN